MFENQQKKIFDCMPKKTNYKNVLCPSTSYTSIEVEVHYPKQKVLKQMIEGEEKKKNKWF